MLWVTSAHVHLDRVASPWLIARFVDDDASFAFLAPGQAVPPEAVPFALPAADLGPHDDQGSTFRKILRRYGLALPELDKMADCVEVGIALALGRPLPEVTHDLIVHGKTMASFSEAMAVLDPDDASNLGASARFYDALYVTLWSGYGSAPELPADVRGRIAALRAARDWNALLPPWTGSRPGPPSHEQGAAH